VVVVVDSVVVVVSVVLVVVSVVLVVSIVVVVSVGLVVVVDIGTPVVVVDAGRVVGGVTVGLVAVCLPRIVPDSVSCMPLPATLYSYATVRPTSHLSWSEGMQLVCTTKLPPPGTVIGLIIGVQLCPVCKLVAEERLGDKTTGWGRAFSNTNTAFPLAQEEAAVKSLKYVNPKDVNKSPPLATEFQLIRTTPTTRTIKRAQE
jgi:hypothetical protein